MTTMPPFGSMGIIIQQETLMQWFGLDHSIRHFLPYPCCLLCHGVLWYAGEEVAGSGKEKAICRLVT